MIRIYHVPGTRSVRVIWLCEELGLDYEVVPVDFSGEYRASPEWRKLNPVGKVPVMIDGDLTLFESGAMVQVLLERYGNGRLAPEPCTDEHAHFLQWCWFAEATFARPLGEIVNHRREFSKAEQSEASIVEMRNRAWVCVEALDKEIAGRTWLCEEFSAADIMTGYSIMLVTRLVPRDLPAGIAAYFQRLEARAGYQVAMSA
ncbi:MAG: glutathione S-transferase [Proteobacteria bacterium]|nr:glutathione S-transferase [Pseudomonadota bacterium]